VKTPEASPVCNYLAPSELGAKSFIQDVPSQPIVSREFVRAVCAPFFEEMVTALQQALQMQMQMQVQAPSVEAKMQQAPAPAPAPAPAANGSFGSGLHFMSHVTTHLDSILDDESTEAEDHGAFASLLSVSSDTSSEDAADAQSSENEASVQSTHHGTEQKINSDGAAMVCRHWKSKGWCRLDANCKFLHPDHERGVDARKVRVVGSADSDGISRVFDPSISITSAEGELCPVLPVRRKKRGGRNRSNRNQQIQLGNPEQDMAGLQPCFFNLYSMLHAADSPC